MELHSLHMVENTQIKVCLEKLLSVRTDMTWLVCRRRNLLSSDVTGDTVPGSEFVHESGHTGRMDSKCIMHIY